MSKHSPIVKIPIKVTHKDDRGVIVNLTLALKGKKVSCTEWITIKAGSVRSNHFHKKSFHFCYLTHGSCRYLWRKVGSKRVNELLVSKGQMVLTPAMVEHAFIALEDTGLITLSDSIRTKSGYEKDVVRLKEKLV